MNLEQQIKHGSKVQKQEIESDPGQESLLHLVREMRTLQKAFLAEQNWNVRNEINIKKAEAEARVDRAINPQTELF